ncbi:MAG TPA: hypothetical protein VH082_02495 [Rudaea sp.]|nr:hypothetical protein [Rudaea sp.]
MGFVAVVRGVTSRISVYAVVLVALALGAPSAFALPRIRHVGASLSSCDFTTIQSAIDGSSSGDTIIIDGGQTYNSQHLTIANKSLGIGAGPCQAVIGSAQNAIAANAQVTLNGDSPSAISAVFTITGAGAVTLSDLKITGNANSNDGGGIEHQGTGTLTLNNVLVTNNSGRNGGGVDVSGTADLVIGNDTQIIGNTANIAGGGIRFASTGDLTAAGTGNLIANNHAPNGFGGGMYVLGGNATITATGIGTQALFYLNDAFSGGGMALRSTAGNISSIDLGDVGTAPLAIDNNSASHDGGGVYVEPFDDGTTQSTAFFSAVNVQLTRNSAVDGAAAYVNCPNGTTTCNVGGDFGMSTDGCSGPTCSLVQTNTATSPNGAVITVKKGSALIKDTRVSDNDGAHLMQVSAGAGLQMSETLIVGNTAMLDLLLASTGSLELAQCTLADNAVGATHLIGVQNAVFDLLNSIVDTDVSAVSQTGGSQTVHNVVGPNIDGLPTANDVVLADPLFVNSAKGDYRLSVTSNGNSFIVSPAVDFSAQQFDAKDIDGRPRPADVAGATNRFGAFDLGVFEMQPIADRIFANGLGDQFLLAQ